MRNLCKHTETRMWKRRWYVFNTSELLFRFGCIFLSCVKILTRSWCSYIYVFCLSLVYTYDASIGTREGTRMFTRAISISIRWHTQAQKHKNVAESRAWTAFWREIWFQHGGLECTLALTTCHLSLRLCLCLRCPGLHVRRNDASTSTSTSTREWKSFHCLVLVLMLASLRHTCKPGQCKRKRKALMLT